MAAKDRYDVIDPTNGPFQEMRRQMVQRDKHQIIVPLVRKIRMRAWDSGTVGYVFWSSFFLPNLSPAATDTSPNYTGSLSGHTIEADVVDLATI